MCWSCRACLLLVFLVAGPASAGVRVDRLGENAAFRHCIVGGESRPATGCAVPRLLVAHKGRIVGSKGRLRVRLPGLQGTAPGTVAIEIEAFAYEKAPSQSTSRRLLRGVDQGLAQTRRHGALARLFSSLVPDARPLPTAVVIVDGQGPRSVTIPAPGATAATRVAFAVWAWPLTATETELPLPELAVPAELLLAPAVQEVAHAGLPPVTVMAELVESERDRPPTTLWQRTLDPATREADRGWQDGVVELPPTTGRRLRLRLRASVPGQNRKRHMVLLARPLLRYEEPSPHERPSILLVSLDTLRADHVGAYGARRPTTPRLDALIEDAVVFERAYSTFPSTTGSHMSMLTSLPVCAHGLIYPTVELPAAIPTVTEQLAARGYATVAITEDGLIKGEAGFDRGFDRYRDLDPNPPSAGGLGVFPTGIALASAWLRNRGPEPFFMFLHTYQPHIPYKIPPYLRGLFTAPGDAPEWQRQEADYDIGVRYTDELLGGFLDFLEASGLLGRIVLVITADHGTEFGERGGYGHARGVHTEQLHVPLIVHHRQFGPPRRISGIVSLLDLGPTFLELAGAAVPKGFTGTSLVSVLRGTSEPPSRQIFGEQIWWGPRQTSLRDGARTWIQIDGSGVTLYEDATDPWEQRDRSREEPELARRGAQAITQFRTSCQAAQQEWRKPPLGIDPERLRALRDLGYVE